MDGDESLGREIVLHQSDADIESQAQHKPPASSVLSSTRRSSIATCGLQKPKFDEVASKVDADLVWSWYKFRSLVIKDEWHTQNAFEADKHLDRHGRKLVPNDTSAFEASHATIFDIRNDWELTLFHYSP